MKLNNLQFMFNYFDYEPLVLHLFILVILSIVTPLIKFHRQKNNKYWTIVHGIFIGLSICLIMQTGISYDNGVYFDGRDVMLIISVTYYGYISSLIAFAIATAYRILLGGSGVIPGILMMVISIVVSSLYVQFFSKTKSKFRPLFFVLISFITHLATVGMLLFFEESALHWRESILPFLVFFPLVTGLLSYMADRQLSYFELMDTNAHTKTMLGAAINSVNNIEIFLLDKDGNYLAFNNFHAQIAFQRSGKHIKIGDYHPALLNEWFDLDLVNRMVAKAMTGENFVVPLQEKDRYFEVNGSPIYDDKHEIMGVRIVVYDTSEHLLKEQEIVRLSERDILTGLYNRYFYDVKVRELLKEKQSFVLVIFDVNGLKTINDTFGHLVGDELLITTGKTISEFFAEIGYVARFGGDEFAVIVPDGSLRHKVISQAEKARVKLLSINFHGLFISMSYGVAENKGEQPFTDTFKEAEDKMYYYKTLEGTSHRNENIKTILSILEARNLRNREHIERTSKFVSEIGGVLKLSNYEIRLLLLICELHDIGNISIDETILQKKGKLTAEEYATIKRHPEVGYKILASTPNYMEIANDVYAHHERYDGKGYPNGLRGLEIPLRARIFSVVDAYDAMISPRPYRDALRKEDAIAELIENRGTQFDPQIVDIFLKILGHNIDF